MKRSQTQRSLRQHKAWVTVAFKKKQAWWGLQLHQLSQTPSFAIWWCSFTSSQISTLPPLHRLWCHDGSFNLRCSADKHPSATPNVFCTLHLGGTIMPQAERFRWEESSRAAVSCGGKSNQPCSHCYLYLCYQLQVCFCTFAPVFCGNTSLHCLGAATVFTCVSFLHLYWICDLLIVNALVTLFWYFLFGTFGKYIFLAFLTFYFRLLVRIKLLTPLMPWAPLEDTAAT